MRHQHTELSSGKHKKKMPFVKSRQPSHKNSGNENQKVSSHYKKGFDPKMCIITWIDAQCVEIQPMWKAFSALWRNFNVKLVTSLDILLVFAIKRNKLHSSLADQRLINYKQEQCMCMRMPYVASLKRVPVITLFACNSKYSTHKLVSRKFPQHLTWLKSCLQVETSPYKKAVS